MEITKCNLLKESDVARILGVSIHCVRRWRYEGRGPRALKLGSLVRYDASDLDTYLSSVPTRGGKWQVKPASVAPNNSDERTPKTSATGGRAH